MIVFERTGAWAAALRRVLGGAIELRSTRSLAECRRELADARQSLVAVELTADSAPQVAEFIVWANEQMAPAQVVVLAPRELTGYADWLREAGAIHFIASPRRLGELERIVERRRARYPSRGQSLQAEIWERLPW